MNFLHYSVLRASAISVPTTKTSPDHEVFSDSDLGVELLDRGNNSPTALKGVADRVVRVVRAAARAAEACGTTRATTLARS